jgi:voltage-dependent potassium channel beta subunit
LFWGGSGMNERGLSRKHIVEGMDASLKRLQLEYVDLVFCHRPDSLTPTDTVVRAMTDLIRSGKAMSWGTSEWPAQKITEAYWIAKMEGLEPPQFEQPEYHLFCRDRVEKEFSPMYERPYNMGLTTWSPLASGLLTGKYNDVSNIPPDSRAKQQGYSWLEGVIQQWKEEGKLDKVQELTEYAKTKLDCSMADLALAWCVKNPNVSCVLLGATKPHQIEDNLKALDVVAKLTKEHMTALESILGNQPDNIYGHGARQIPTI